MAITIPDSHPTFIGQSYGMKVLDPVDGHEIFNAKYPIFGHDITSRSPKMITHRVILGNNATFSEPPVNIPWSVDGQWHTSEYYQLENKLIATIPHGAGAPPLFMVTGSAHVRRNRRARYYRRDSDGELKANSVYLPTPTNAQFVDFAPRLGGVNGLLPYPLSVQQNRFDNIPDIGTTMSPNVFDVGDFTFNADTLNIYIRCSLKEPVMHQIIRENWGGWDRFLKFWSDLTGSWYEFTFYILPYTKGDDIFIR